MKNKLIVIGLFTLLSHTTFAAAAKEIVVSVNGMVCSMCSRGITKNFNSQAGDAVQDVNVNMDEKVVRVTLKEGKTISDELVTKIIKDAGVAVVKIDRK